jgi:hypothetical protein
MRALLQDGRVNTMEKLKAQLMMTIDRQNEMESVQHLWNALERSLVEIVDKLASMVVGPNNTNS